MRNNWRLAACAVVLVACNSGPDTGTVQSTFTVNGVADWAPPSPVTLQYTFLTGGNTVTVGTLGTDRSVKLSFTPALVEKAGFSNKAGFLSTFLYRDCNTSTLNVSNDFQYFLFHTSDIFPAAGQEWHLRARVTTPGTSGETLVVTRYFAYVKNGASITGKGTCPSFDMNINVALRPGWNVLKESYVQNLDANYIKNYSLTVASYATTDTGNWLVTNAHGTPVALR